MPKTYITTQGDTWDSIALKFYNDEKLFHHLIEANTKYIDVVIFSANIELIIPKINVPIMDTNNYLPSWRK